MSHCHVTHSQKYGTILSGRLSTVVVSHEWSIGPALHCNHLSAHLAGLNGTACLHVSLALIAQVWMP
jgi:hypothetical protein